MIRFAPIIVLLQIFCLYHVYKKNEDQKWYWLIIFFPLIGCIIYLFKTFYNKENIDNLEEGVKHALVKNYKIDKLEKQLKHSDTVANKIELANEHARVGNYTPALNLYKDCATGIFKDDPELMLRTLMCQYQLKNYKAVMDLGNQLAEVKAFENSEEKIAFAWSYFYENDIEKAETIFAELDTRNMNYIHRLEFAKFLKASGRVNAGKDKLAELLEEMDSMDKYERRSKKAVYNAIKAEYFAKS